MLTDGASGLCYSFRFLLIVKVEGPAANGCFLGKIPDGYFGKGLLLKQLEIGQFNLFLRLLCHFFINGHPFFLRTLYICCFFVYCFHYCGKIQ